MLQQFEKESEYTKEMLKIQGRVVEEYRKYTRENSTDDKLIKSLGSKVSDKNVSYIGIKEKKILSAAEFRTEWFRGLEESCNKELKEIVCNEYIRKYIELYLERMYIRYSKRYGKNKILQSDREIFLGDNNNLIGIFIAPRKEKVTWNSYQSKGLKAKYVYLTLGQLVEEGYLIGSAQNWRMDAQQVNVNTLEDVETFYSYFKQSGSPYEKKFIDNYIRYITCKKEWKGIPMLLPEVRLDKENIHHRYRIDYLIINYLI